MQLLGDKRLVAIRKSTEADVSRVESRAVLALMAVAQQASSNAFEDVRAFQCAVKKAVQSCTAFLTSVCCALHIGS